MIRISILYPNRKGSRFDHRYYVETHMPVSIELLGRHPGFKGASVERGVAGAVPNYTDVEPVIQVNEVVISR